MFRFLAISVSFLLSTSPALADGPFGIQMGQPLSSLDVAEAGLKPRLSSVSKPHPDFNHYVVWATEETGVCAVIAFSKFYENDRYGNNVRGDFSKFTDALTDKYGPSKLIDTRNSGGLWKDADEWVMSLKQNERLFASTWDTPMNSGKVNYLELRVLATSSDTSFLRIMYKGDNFTECEKIIDAASNGNF